MASGSQKRNEPVVHQESAPLNNKFQGAVLDEYAQGGVNHEHDMTPLEAIKTHPMALFWCLMVSMCVVMEGYDTILIGNFFAYPAFARKYGVYVPSTDNYQITAAWQSALGNSGGIGAFFGALLNGHLVSIFGQKRVLLGALVVLSAFIFMTVFAKNLTILFIGEIMCGFPWGVFATTAPAYASEVLPLPLRVFFTSYTNMCFIMGQLIAAGILSAFSDKKDWEWAYRIPFAIQWVWPVILFPVLLFSPESPWHLVRTGRLEEAEQSIRRLQRSSADLDPKQTLALIVHTNNIEQELTAGTSYMDCFRGVERRRTEIACMAFAGQVFVGSLFAYNSTYFFQQIGFSPTQTYQLNVGSTAMALFGTFCNWFILLPRFGRRRIYLVGTATMTTFLFIIAFLQVAANAQGGKAGALLNAQGAFTMLWTFTFQLSVGQLGWAIPAEMGSTRLRQKTIVLARNAYYLASVVARTLEPYFLNPMKWNIKGFTGFVWGTTGLLTLAWAYFRLPETKDRTFDEIDLLFVNRVKARHFASTDVNTFDEAEPAGTAARFRDEDGE